MNRSIRNIIAIVIAAFFIQLIVLNSAIAETSASGAQKFIESIGGNTIKIVKDQSLDASTKQTKLEELFKTNVDIKWIGNFVLGRYSKEANDTQKKDYDEYYSKFLINSYVPKFKGYTDQELVVKKVDKENDGYLVQTEIVSKSDKKKNINVNYKVKSVNGGYKIFDVIAEGVSLITTQRSEFASVISRNGLQSLIDKLKVRSTANR